MPKRILDGDALWRSKKIRQVQPVKFRAEYANLLPLALSTGSFECDADTIWTDVYAFNRPDVTPEDVAAILDEYEKVKLLFRWTVDGKTWGYWVGIDKEGRLPTGTAYSHAKKGPFPPAGAYKAFAGVDRVERSMSGQDPVADRQGIGLGLGKGLGVGLGLGSGLGEPTSTSSNPNSETNELRSNSSTLNPTATPTPTPEPDAPAYLNEMVEAMVARYPRTCRPEAKSDWEMCFRNGITKMANELFGGKIHQAATFVGKKLDVFIEKSKAADNIYAPVKFFSEWIDKDFDVKALRKKKRMDDEF
jgi:hypothetical protein